LCPARFSQASTDKWTVGADAGSGGESAAERPGQALADSGFFSPQENLEENGAAGRIDAYVPIRTGAGVESGCARCADTCGTASGAATHEMQARSPAGRGSISEEKRSWNGTGSSEGAARDAAISVARAGEMAVEFTLAATALTSRESGASAPSCASSPRHQAAPQLSPHRGYEKLVVTATNHSRWSCHTDSEACASPRPRRKKGEEMDSQKKGKREFIARRVAQELPTGF